MKVVCVDNQDMEDELELNKVYDTNLKDFDGGMINVDGFYYFEGRFKEVFIKPIEDYTDEELQMELIKRKNIRDKKTLDNNADTVKAFEELYSIFDEFFSGIKKTVDSELDS